MKQLDLKITNNANIDSYFFVDGKKLKFKKNNYGNYFTIIETENDEIEIKIYEWNEYRGGLWFIMPIIYFIISFFGVLDVKQNKKFKSIDCNFKVKLGNEENFLKLTYNKFKSDDIAVIYEGNCEIEIYNNKYFIDEISKKRYKIMKIIKLVILAIVVIGIILFLR